ncbi:MAG: carbohydrate ABC transporter permease [Sphaerochaetaceae bacterium]|jgi:putative aldouronate transport system permease protein|nr:carbohydrate ABC transporter permease [Sphaerochaetaceae bacterium]
MVIKSKNDTVFEVFVFLLVLLVGLVCLVPVMYVVSVSLTPIEEKLRSGGFLLIPRKITFSAYRQVLGGKEFLPALWVTVKVTVIGTFLQLVATLLFAYPLSRTNLPGRKLITKLVVFTMLFSAGMIPLYLVVKGTHLLNTLWSMIIPSLINVYNLIIMKAFFEGLPGELFESARIDGAGEMTVLLKVALPLSMPIIMTIGLYYGVEQWNTYMRAVLYVSKDSLQPLQVVLRRLLAMAASTDILEEEIIPTETLQMANVVLSTLPLVCIYPFIQKYFVRGTLAGAVKG